jgi:hypothetical protein
MVYPLLSLVVAVALVLIASFCAVFLARWRRNRTAATESRANVLPLEPRPAVVSQADFHVARASGLTHRDAESLLDWLEQHGYEERELVCEADGLFGVEFRVDAGHLKPRILPVPNWRPTRPSSVG